MSRVKDKALQSFVGTELVIGSLNDLDLSGIGFRQCIFRNELGEWISKKLEFADDINGAPVGLPSKSTTTNVDPTINDDTLLGYTEGSFWLNTTSKTAFICVDPFEAMAVWKVISDLDTTRNYEITGAWVFEGGVSQYFVVNADDSVTLTSASSVGLYTSLASAPININSQGLVSIIGRNAANTTGVEISALNNSELQMFSSGNMRILTGGLGTSCDITSRAINLQTDNGSIISTSTTTNEQIAGTNILIRSLNGLARLTSDVGDIELVSTNGTLTSTHNNIVMQAYEGATFRGTTVNNILCDNGPIYVTSPNSFINATSQIGTVVRANTGATQVQAYNGLVELYGSAGVQILSAAAQVLIDSNSVNIKSSTSLALQSSTGTIQVNNPSATGGTVFYDKNFDPVLTIKQEPGAYDITAALTYTAPLSNSLMTRAHVNTVINSAIPYAYYYVDDCVTSSGGTLNQINLMLLSTGTTSNLVQNFTVGNNLFTYTGTTTYNFQVNFTFTPIVTSNDRTLHVYLYKNTSTTPNPLLANRVAGSRIVSIVRTMVDDTESVSGQCFISLAQNDFVRFYVVNAENNDNMTIVDARVSIRKI